MNPSFVLLLLTLAGHAVTQDTVSILPPPPPTGLFSSLTGFLPSFPSLPSLPTLPSLSVGPLPCVGLSTLSQGSCVSSDSCAVSGGSSDSGCLTSNQVCCIPSLKCGSTVSSTDAWVTNNEYPNGTRVFQSCVYTINKASPVVSQLRIHLDSLTLSPPSTSGQCVDDRLVVEGVTGVNVFPLCGVSKGAHIILPFTLPALSLRVIVSGVEGVERKWRVHVTQVAQNAVSLAPAGCTQLYSADGTLTSLNPGVGGLKYAVCFQKKPGTCGLRLDMSSLLGSRVSPLSPVASVSQHSHPITRLSKRQVGVASALGATLPTLPSNIFLPSIVKTNVETAQNGDQKATADIFNLQFLNNGLRIGKEVVVQNTPPTQAPSTPAPLPVLVQKTVEQKPMTPHYYGGRYYPHSHPAPAYSAPLPAPVPAPVPVKSLVEKALFIPDPSAPVRPLLQSNLALGAGVNGLVDINNNLTATVGNPLLAPLPIIPVNPLVAPVLPNLTLPNLLQPATLPVIQTTQTTQPGGIFTDNGVGVSSNLNTGLTATLGSTQLGSTQLGSTLASGVRARRQDGHTGENPQLCHETMFAAPRTIVCLENYTGAQEILLIGGSPFEILYVEAARSGRTGVQWEIPFSFVAC